MTKMNNKVKKIAAGLLTTVFMAAAAVEAFEFKFSFSSTKVTLNNHNMTVLSNGCVETGYYGSQQEFKITSQEAKNIAEYITGEGRIVLERVPPAHVLDLHVQKQRGLITPADFAKKVANYADLNQAMSEEEVRQKIDALISNTYTNPTKKAPPELKGAILKPEKCPVK